METKQIAKLFGVLVIGGALNAKAEEPSMQPSVDLPTQTICQVEVIQKKYNSHGDVASQTVVCVDEKSIPEITKLIEDAKAQSCLSPFCGCWLG